MKLAEKVKRMVNLAKAAAADERLPRYLRWIFRMSFATKAMPFPDFGLDEVGLVVGIVLLHTLYREAWNEIKADLT